MRVCFGKTENKEKKNGDWVGGTTMVHPTLPRPHTTRRSLLKAAVFGSVAALAAPYVKDSYAAGSLALGVWDHWVQYFHGVVDHGIGWSLRNCVFC